MADGNAARPESEGAQGLDGEPAEDAAAAAAEAEEEEEYAITWTSSDSESDSDSDSDGGDYGGGAGYNSDDDEPDDNTPETNIRKFTRVLESRSMRKRQAEEERKYVYHEDLYDFPKDPERWSEADLQELWTDPPLETTKTGWDPDFADDEDWAIATEEIKAGREPAIAPFYLPYRKPLPAIPDDHHDISNPKSVIEELDRIEEFLTWVSYIFSDGSSYEGTVWDDLAHGKGVYVAEEGLVRYEGEWLQNQMEGHGVIEVDIPGVEPVPGSKLEAKMRAEGRIIKRDFMSPEDKKWMEMDIEDSMKIAGHIKETPFYENDEWINVFGKKPEKGRYKYAGQWKHGRMHGCGVYEVNERIIYGRFYFGDRLEDSSECDSDISMLHAGIAEVAAAKARMFVNKPDGMVREERGPYGDPQHPYFYEEDDVWMAPGFVNQFYEVPDYWKTYVEEVDKERELWLNSFYKAPLRIPMPAELEYWWSTDKNPEFLLINKEPEPDPEDPSKLIYKEDPLILHTPTGRLINYVDDDEHGIRLFWQPHREENGDIDPDKAVFLPLGFDEFYGRAKPGVKKEGPLMRLVTSIENALKPLFDKLEKWVEEKKKASEMNQKLIEKELELVEAEIVLEEEIAELEFLLKMQQREEEKKVAAGKAGDDESAEAGKDAPGLEDEEDEEEDDSAPASFGTVGQAGADDTSRDATEDKKFRKPPFSSLSMSFTSCNPAILVSSKVQEAFLSWRRGNRKPLTCDRSSSLSNERCFSHHGVNTVKFPYVASRRISMRTRHDRQSVLKKNSNRSQLNSLARILSLDGACRSSEVQAAGSLGSSSHNLNILSLHVPVIDFVTL